MGETKVWIAMDIEEKIMFLLSLILQVGLILFSLLAFGGKIPFNTFGIFVGSGSILYGLAVFVSSKLVYRWNILSSNTTVYNGWWAKVVGLGIMAIGIFSMVVLKSA